MDHIFSEANQCDRVPVTFVPVSDAHPAGLRWQRPCLCPKWTELENEIIRSARQGTDGQPIIVTEKVLVQGCLFKLLPWILGTQIRKANESLADVGKLRQEVDRARQETGEALRAVGVGFHTHSQGLFAPLGPGGLPGQLAGLGQGPDSQNWNSAQALFALLLGQGQELHTPGDQNRVAPDEDPLSTIEPHEEIATEPEVLE